MLCECGVNDAESRFLMTDSPLPLAAQVGRWWLFPPLPRYRLSVAPFSAQPELRKTAMINKFGPGISSSVSTLIQLKTHGATGDVHTW